jgi:hypothetical protein
VIFLTNEVTQNVTFALNLPIIFVQTTPDIKSSALASAGNSSPSLNLLPGANLRIQFCAEFNPVRHQDHQASRVSQQHLAWQEKPEQSPDDGISAQFDHNSRLRKKRLQKAAISPSGVLWGEKLLEISRIYTANPPVRDF